MRRPALSDAEFRGQRQSRVELEKLLARAKRVIEAFATSDDTRDKPDSPPPGYIRLLPSPLA